MKIVYWGYEKWMIDWEDRLISYGCEIGKGYLIICDKLEYEDEYINFGEKIALL